MMAANYEYEDGPAAKNEEVERESGGEIGYDPQYVPDSVKSFVVHMYRHIREKNVYEIHQMCETSFQSLSERLFKETPWPSVEAIAPYVDNDHVFCLLYREMWFRHLYARLSPTLKQRIDSYDNYCSLFQVVLHGVVNMQLPNQWLWDMVDEFVYQFQSFCQFRAKLKNKTEQELALLRQHDKAWNVYGVLNFLQALVEKSSIIQILEQDKQGLEQFTATDGYDYSGGSNVLKVLGYFSMVGLLRVHCLLGDYHTALKWLQPIDISQQGVYISVIGCHIATMYHYGFANLMLRRYVDAVREFNKILLYIYKTKQYHQKSPQYEQILKKNEQMYALLAVCLSLCPQTKLVDESVNSQLREKYGDKMMRMQRYDDDAFGVYDELFSYACPKFITPSAPSFEEPLVNYNQDAYRLQLKMFLYETLQKLRMDCEENIGNESLILIKQGAEARVFESTFAGRRSIVKERFSKKYRHPILDSKLTLKRSNAEARCMTKARKLGVCTPVLYAVDPLVHSLTLEYIEGDSVKDIFLEFGANVIVEERLDDVAAQIGGAIAKLHDGGLAHGDLTTSNMLVRSGTNQLVLIDFGLSFTSTLPEDKAVDLYVLERALLSMHSSCGNVMDRILTSYRKSSKQWSATFNKLAQVRQRGRKRTMIG